MMNTELFFCSFVKQKKRSKYTPLIDRFQFNESKFVRLDAKRIISSSNTGKLLTTAFINKNGKLAVIVMNPTDSKIKYHVWIVG